MVDDVESGAIDAGFVLSGWFEQAGQDRMGNFHFLGVVENPTFDGQPYPFLTSTPIVPGFALAARPDLPDLLQARAPSSAAHAYEFGSRDRMCRGDVHDSIPVRSTRALSHPHACGSMVGSDGDLPRCPPQLLYLQFACFQYPCWPRY